MKIVSSLLCFGLVLAADATRARASELSARDLLFAYRAATGGDAWAKVTGMRLEGMVTAGGSPGSFVETIDRRLGRYRLSTQTGPQADLSGYDGAPWVAQNGNVTQIDLPPLIPDALTRAFELRAGWWDQPAETSRATDAACPAIGCDLVRLTPRGGSPMDIWLDRQTHLILRTVLHGDGGDVTALYADWHDVNGVHLPFRREEIDADGAHTLYQALNVAIGPVAPMEVARPRAAPRGHLPPGGASVRFRLDATDHGHIVVPASIDGAPVDLIFDTGAANYVTPGAASRLNLNTAGGVNLAGVSGGGINGGYAHAARITLGAAELRDETVIVGKLPYVAMHPRAGMDIDGLTGFEFLASFRTTIDYAQRTLEFSAFGAPLGGGTTLPFFSDEHNIYVTAEINGATGLFRVDTGDGGGITVFQGFAARHRLFASGGHTSMDAGGLGGTLHTEEFPTARFALAGVVFQDIPVTLARANAGSFASRAIAGNLGAAVLSRFRITFDYKAHCLTFTPAANISEPFRVDHAGLSFTQTRADRLEVLAVRPDGGAGRAGLRTGDAVIAIDGETVASAHLGVFDLRAKLSSGHPVHVRAMRNGAPVEATILPESK